MQHSQFGILFTVYNELHLQWNRSLLIFRYYRELQGCRFPQTGISVILSFHSIIQTEGCEWVMHLVFFHARTFPSPPLLVYTMLVAMGGSASGDSARAPLCPSTCCIGHSELERFSRTCLWTTSSFDLRAKEGGYLLVSHYIIWRLFLTMGSR